MNYLDVEKNVLKSFCPGRNILLNGKDLKIIECGKPRPLKGECKTDVYVLLNDGTELKISIKKDNADFLENKIRKERAKEIFGPRWMEIIKEATLDLKESFLKKTIYYPTASGRVQAGSYTLGWRADIINKNSGKLTKKLNLTTQEKIDILAGINLEEEKRNSYINNKKIINSGIANYILDDVGNDFEYTAQNIIDKLIAIQDYSFKEDFFITFRAVNYRSFTKEYEKARALAVYVNWENKENPQFCFEEPLIYTSTNLAKQFKNI